jgi:hypothetical protein
MAVKEVRHKPPIFISVSHCTARLEDNICVSRDPHIASSFENASLVYGKLKLSDRSE